ncbi:hypothetical protein [Desulfofustis limnaeus]|uniref:hypothetical protein n=1 Tax=Desulfofustis limnaeus TaxID=2740163 RepID=UPI0024DFADAD|nr:hypothetical protein [Desulfofustis limnaeus]
MTKNGVHECRFLRRNNAFIENGIIQGALKAWASENPPIVVLVSQLAAILPETIVELLDDIGEPQKLTKMFGEPEPSFWLRMYRSYAVFNRRISEMIPMLGTAPAIYAQIHEALRGAGNLTQINSETKCTHKLDEILTHHYEYIQDDLDNKPISEAQRDTIFKTLVTQDFHFLVRVVLPCVVLYREHSVLLYRKARLGHPDSLDKLLRLDKMLLRDPSINKWIYRYSQKTAGARTYEMLTEALRSPPRPHLSRQQIKIRVAGALSFVTEVLGHRLSAPSIQNLFDAVSVDYGKDDLRDYDLPDAPESFSQAVRRERNILLSKLKKASPTKLS